MHMGIRKALRSKQIQVKQLGDGSWEVTQSSMTATHGALQVGPQGAQPRKTSLDDRATVSVGQTRIQALNCRLCIACS